MGFAGDRQKAMDIMQEDKKKISPEFIHNLEEREEQLVNRIYKLSQLLSDTELPGDQEEQIKMILEDALAELDALNMQLNPQNKKKRFLFQ